jgi:hypothetical protein
LEPGHIHTAAVADAVAAAVVVAKAGSAERAQVDQPFDAVEKAEVEDGRPGAATRCRAY